MYTLRAENQLDFCISFDNSSSHSCKGQEIIPLILHTHFPHNQKVSEATDKPRSNPGLFAPQAKSLTTRPLTL